MLGAAGMKPTDVHVIELHDCFSANELITYEALGLCKRGEAAVRGREPSEPRHVGRDNITALCVECVQTLVDSGATTYGGQWVVNPSGGLISKGHPLGATGLAQCAELTWQLRGEAGARQVRGASVALQHNLGLGGAAVVTLYRKA